MSKIYRSGSRSDGISIRTIVLRRAHLLARTIKPLDLLSRRIERRQQDSTPLRHNPHRIRTFHLPPLHAAIIDTSKSKRSKPLRIWQRRLLALVPQLRAHQLYLRMPRRLRTDRGRANLSRQLLKLALQVRTTR